MSEELDNPELEKYYDIIFEILLTNFSKIVKSKQEETGARYCPQIDLLDMLIWNILAVYASSIFSGVLSNLISAKIQERYEMFEGVSIKKEESIKLIRELLPYINEPNMGSIQNSEKNIIRISNLLETYGWSKREADKASKEINESLLKEL